MKRSQKTMAADFITKPQDHFVITFSKGLSSTIPILVTNGTTDESFYLGLQNKIGSWKLLKQINEIEAREVFVELENKTIIKFEESAPYLCRFK